MVAGRRWRALLTDGPRRLRSELALRRAAALLRRSARFDAAWYRATYPDVANAGLDPVRHYLRAGAAEGRDPGPRFSSGDYLARNSDVARTGINPLLHYLRNGRAEGRAIEPTSPAYPATDLAPLHGFRTPQRDAPRVTLLTDSLAPGSLFGGVGTALLFVTLLAQRTGAELRIVTETQPPDVEAAARLLRLHGVAPPMEMQVDFAERHRPERRDIEVRDADLFVSTAWWNTWNLLHAVAPRQVIHLLQDDERMFYPHGDLHLLSNEVLATPGLRFAVNTRLLHEHLTTNGLGHVARDGAWFEPAFPRDCYHWQERGQERGQERADAPRRFVFYARPNHPRSLYRRGLEVVSAAIERRILDPAQWRFTFVGRDLPEIELPRGVRPQRLENLAWADYAALVRQCDLGLCLMYTPHPSYPPLDLAASGAVAVTNRFGNKQSLAAYSDNILCVDSTLDGLLEGLDAGARLAADLPTRRRNYAQSGLGRDWAAAFAPVFDKLLAA